jgi:hypothetical protein
MGLMLLAMQTKEFCYRAVWTAEGILSYAGITTGFSLEEFMVKFNVIDRTVEGMIHSFFAICSGVGLNIIISFIRKYRRDKNKGTNES